MHYQIVELERRSLIPRSGVGNPQRAEAVDRLLQLMGGRGGRLFRVTWKGSLRAVRGVSLGGQRVEWTQHGRVLNADGEGIGVYERIKDREGPDQESEILILISV